MERVAPVAQGIEHFSPKEGVGRSNRLGGTDSVTRSMQLPHGGASSGFYFICGAALPVLRAQNIKVP